jgi:hypothetical protein
MKAIGIPHHDLSSDYYEINFVKVWQSSQTSRLFTRRFVDEPECKGQFLTMVTQMKHLFFFHIMHEP